MALAEKLRSGARTVGYWVLSDNPQGVERIAGAGYDYVCFDAQHGLLDYRALLVGMTALDARGARASCGCRTTSSSGSARRSTSARRA